MEFLIIAHDCHTLCCSVGGIADLLVIAQSTTNKLVAGKHFKLMIGKDFHCSIVIINFDHSATTIDTKQHFHHVDLLHLLTELNMTTGSTIPIKKRKKTENKSGGMLSSDFVHDNLLCKLAVGDDHCLHITWG